MSQVSHRVYGRAIRAAADLPEGFVRELPAEESHVFLVSDAVEARDGDIWAAPWFLEDYRENPVVQWAHDYEKKPVGRCVQIVLIGEQLWAEVAFDLKSAEGAEVDRQYREGFMSAVSAGVYFGAQSSWTPRRSYEKVHPWYSDGWGWVRQGITLLEFSAVPVPSLPSALKVRGVPETFEHVTADPVERLLGDEALLERLRSRLAEPATGADTSTDEGGSTDPFDDFFTLSTEAPADELDGFFS